MRYYFIAFALWVGIAVSAPAQSQEDSHPAGFIISYDLKGVDREKGNGTVIHEDKELPPKLWMPLFPGDKVFIRDPDSSIVLDTVKTGRFELKGDKKEFKVEGRGTTDKAWDIATQIGKLFGSEEEEDAPTNLISKGDGSLEIPMAVRGPNFLTRDARPLWMAWQGGKEPYGITLDIGGVRRPLATVAATEFEMALPDTAKNRFVIVIEDSLGKRMRVTFRIHKAAPDVPRELAGAAARRGAEQAVLAGWLAAQENGAWRFEAARILRALPKDDKTAASLLTALAKGWRPHE